MNKLCIDAFSNCRKMENKAFFIINSCDHKSVPIQSTSRSRQPTLLSLASGLWSHTWRRWRKKIMTIMRMTFLIYSSNSSKLKKNRNVCRGDIDIKYNISFVNSELNYGFILIEIFYCRGVKYNLRIPYKSPSAHLLIDCIVPRATFSHHWRSSLFGRLRRYYCDTLSVVCYYY